MKNQKKINIKWCKKININAVYLASKNVLYNRIIAPTSIVTERSLKKHKIQKLNKKIEYENLETK